MQEPTTIDREWIGPSGFRYECTFWLTSHDYEYGADADGNRGETRTAWEIDYAATHPPLRDDDARDFDTFCEEVAAETN